MKFKFSKKLLSVVALIMMFITLIRVEVLASANSDLFVQTGDAAMKTALILFLIIVAASYGEYYFEKKKRTDNK